jgi:hypothetical protein
MAGLGVSCAKGTVEGCLELTSSPSSALRAPSPREERGEGEEREGQLA